LRSHDSGWAAYQRERDEREAKEEAATQAARPEPVSAGGRNAGRAAKKAVRKATRLAEQIEQAEAELRELEEELADPEAWSSPGRAERAEARHAAAKRAVAELVERWEEAEAEAERASSPAAGPG
jgi:hypothetical protein